MATNEILQRISASLQILTLSEEDLDFDVVSAAMKNLKAEVIALETESDASPLLLQWLPLEVLRGGILSASAKINYSKELADGESSIFGRQAREHLLDSFNLWSAQAGLRLDTYRASADEPHEVTKWIADLRR